jgi:hypothetical protein
MTPAFSSPYYINLKEEDKKNYISKLTLCDGVVLPDPFSFKDNWSNDVSLLPDITWPEMYIYLIETPSEFTKDKLRAYKSLEAYNFFLNGHVQDVFYYDIKDTEFCYTKCEVLISVKYFCINIFRIKLNKSCDLNIHIS